jgi:tape measure domain-containing protein
VADDRKEIELLIRANLKGGRDLKAITESVAALKKAIESQAAAAKRGESSYEGLKSSLEALKGVQEELSARSKLLKRFEDLAAAVKASNERVDQARAKYEALNKTLKDVEASGKTVTATQQQSLTRLSASLDKAQKRVETYSRSYEDIRTALQATGIATDNLAAANATINSSTLQAATAVARLNTEFEQYSDNLRRGREEAAKLAKQQELLERLQAGNAADARLGVQQQIERAKGLEQVEANRLAALQELGRVQRAASGKDAAASELAAIRDSEKFLREYNEQKVRSAALDAGLRKTADDAEAAARQYSTLARASTNLRPRVVSLAEAIEQIRNPAAATAQTLDGVEKQISDLAAGIGKINGPIADAADQFRKLQAAQKAIGQQASLLDDFRNQTAALREVRTELSAARGQVAQYAAELRKGGEGAQQFVKPLAEAEARLKRSAAALREQIAVTRQSREALRQAGVDTGNLAAAQDRLVQGARAATAATQSLTAAVKQYGVASEGVKRNSIFGDEGRTTLSLAQRIRGEILALAAAYVGLQGVIGLAAGSLKAFNQQQALSSGLVFALGDDQKAVAEEIQFLVRQADRLGVSFEEASKSYAKFAAAAVKSGAPLQEVRFIFESFAETGRVLNLTPDQLNGLFNAIGQSFSKTKIQAEELRGQIGERLPGAFAFAQEALKDFFPDLDKALEQGQVGAENLLLIAESVRKAAASSLPTAIRSLDAEQQRFNNSVLFFKKEIADAGFADAYVNLLKELTTFLGSEDGKNFARDISGAFIGVANALRTVVALFVEFRAELSAVGGALLALAGVALFGKVIAGAVAAKAALTGVAVALTLVQKAMLVFSAFVIGWNIGAYFRDKFVEVRLAGIALVVGFAEVWSRIKFGAMELWENLPRLAANSFRSLIKLFTNIFVRPFLRLTRLVADALKLDAVVSGIDKALGAITLTLNDQITDRTAAIRKEAEDDLKRIRDIGDGLVQDALRAPVVKPVATPGGPTTSPGRRAGKNTGPSEGEIAKRQRQIEAITRALETLDAKIDRTQTDSLANQLSAIDTEYAALARRIRELGGTEAVAFLQQLEASVGQLKLQTTRKFNDRILAEQEALLSKIESAEAAAGRRDKGALDARLKAIADSYAGTYRDIAEQRAKLEANGRDTAPADESKRRLDAAVAELTILERQKFFKDELARRETQINDLLGTRAQRLKTIEEQFDAGLLTQQQADDQQRAVIAELQPQIEALVVLGQNFATSINGAFDPAALQEFLARLSLAQAGAARLNLELDRTGNIIRSGIGQGVTAAIDTLYESLLNAAQATSDWGDVFDNVGKSILQTLANILREIGAAILKQQILIALRAVGVPVAHSGMVVGAGSNRNRNVNPGLFATAPRYHSGGIVGLAPDEYPAILQKNEEVLSTSDPRNVLNGALKQGSTQPQSQRFVLVDDRSRVAEAMAGSEGEAVTMVHLRKNIPTLRQMLK